MEKRLGFVGIVIDDRTMAAKVNAILSDYSEIINGRIGVPNNQDGTSVIGLVVEASNEQIGAMTGNWATLQM